MIVKEPKALISEKNPSDSKFKCKKPFKNYWCITWIVLERVPEESQKQMETEEENEKQLKLTITNLQKEIDEKEKFIKRIQRSSQSFDYLAAEVVPCMMEKLDKQEDIIHKQQSENSKLDEAMKTSR